MPTRRSLPLGFFLALMSVFMAIPAACAHASPGAFVNCMEDSGKGAALINAVEAILDSDNRVQVLESLAITVAPDVLKCVLEQIASAKAVGPTGNQRALRAREYLDSHGGGARAECGGLPAMAHGESLLGHVAVMTDPIWRGFCPMLGCLAEPPPGIGPGPGGG